MEAEESQARSIENDSRSESVYALLQQTGFWEKEEIATDAV